MKRHRRSRTHESRFVLLLVPVWWHRYATSFPFPHWDHLPGPSGIAPRGNPQRSFSPHSVTIDASDERDGPLTQPSHVRLTTMVGTWDRCPQHIGSTSSAHGLGTPCTDLIEVLRMGVSTSVRMAMRSPRWDRREQRRSLSGSVERAHLLSTSVEDPLHMAS